VAGNAIESAQEELAAAQVVVLGLGEKGSKPSTDGMPAAVRRPGLSGGSQQEHRELHVRQAHGNEFSGMCNRLVGTGHDTGERPKSHVLGWPPPSSGVAHSRQHISPSKGLRDVVARCNPWHDTLSGDLAKLANLEGDLDPWSRT